MTRPISDQHRTRYSLFINTELISFGMEFEQDHDDSKTLQNSTYARYTCYIQL